MKPITTESTLERLRSELEEIESALAALIAGSSVRYSRHDYGVVVVAGRPDYYFVDPSGSQLRDQVALRKRYLAWFERFALLYRQSSDDLEHRISSAHKDLLNWIDLGSNFEIGPDPDANAVKSRSCFVDFRDLLEVLDGDGDVVVVPDTNALLKAPCPEKYSSVVGSARYRFVLLPTVLAELDHLKNLGRNEAVREKAQKLVRRIGGWRRQGSLTEGVTLHQTVTVKAVAAEPNVAESLSWLDPTNNDDRIIASVLELQSEEPSSLFWLVTGDINLQNKADAAMLTCTEPP